MTEPRAALAAIGQLADPRSTSATPPCNLPASMRRMPIGKKPRAICRIAKGAVGEPPTSKREDLSRARGSGRFFG